MSSKVGSNHHEATKSSGIPTPSLGPRNETDVSDLNSGNEENQNSHVSKALLKLKLLDSLRQGDFEQLKQLIKTQFQPENDANVIEVRQLVLHYAVQVAPLSLIKEILNNWSNALHKRKRAQESDVDIHLDINHQDDDGNTPLHLAAFQSRGDVVAFLMDQPNINDCVLNDSHLQPVEMCKNLNIAQMMQVKRANYVAEVAQEFRTAFNNRDFGHLESILSAPRNSELLDINGMDPETGDTVLHEFVKKKDVIMCRWLLEHGADPFKRDRQGKLPIDLLGKVNESETATNTKTAIDIELKKLLAKAAKEQSVIDVTNNLHEAPTYKGYLKKWTNFAQGYKLRWFILSSDGKLSYYKDQSDTRNACRGSLNMSTCYLHLDSSEKLKFEIIGGSNGTIRWHLKANHPIETNRWVWAIQGAIRFSKDREMVIKSGTVPPSLAMNRAASPAPNVQKLHPYEGPYRSQYIQGSKYEKIGQPVQQKQSRAPSSSSSSAHQRKKSTSTSVTSSEIGFSDNLTESGKNYINKVIENRIESNSRGSSVKNFSTNHSMNESTNNNLNKYSSSKSTGPSTNGVFQNSEANTSSLNDFAIDNSATANAENIEGISDDEDDDDDDIDIDADEEDVKIKYGPYAQKLTMLQRSISMELSSLNELLENDASKTADEEVWRIVKVSLNTIAKTFEKLNSLTSERDKRLVTMLSKQRDVNNVWIQSVRDLEIELIDKSNRLASLDKERRNLKRLLQKKLTEAGESVTTPNVKEVEPESIEKEASTSALQEIAELIDAARGEEAESDGEEFYDAEELVEEADMERELMDKPSKNDIAKKKEIQLSDNKLTFEDISQNQKSGLDTHVSRSKSDATSDESSVAAPADEKKAPIEYVGEVTEERSQVESLPVSNESQEKMKKLILSEGTYLGYEDGVRKRLRLDKDDRPSISLWSVLKSMVGKDMTRMTLPVSFNEPTSLLQRVAEDLEYTSLLDEAAAFSDSSLRLLYVAVFTASSYASTIGRVAKPFNPLLGETFEYARADKHYRFFTEQVSHHPPISATWTESPKWDFWGESNVDSKFNGRSFAFKHLGWWHIKLRPDETTSEDMYTWKKPNNTVIGILVGNPQVDNHGDVKIVNHTTGDFCLLNFKARGWRSSGAYEVKGEVFNKKNQKMWILGGHWNDAIYAKKVTANNNEELSLKKTITKIDSDPNFEGSKFLVWKANPRPSAPFNLTPFAITLNAPQPSLVPWLAPTDTRLRPDQRDMEEGLYDKAADEKHRLEEKQRAVRKERDNKGEVYVPKWFVKEFDPITKSDYWKFKGNYWSLRKDHKLKGCGDIF